MLKLWRTDWWDKRQKHSHIHEEHSRDTAKSWKTKRRAAYKHQRDDNPAYQVFNGAHAEKGFILDGTVVTEPSKFKV